jgi:hypothetical protein
MVSFLLDYCADANLRSSDGRIPLDVASHGTVQKQLAEVLAPGASRSEFEHKFLDLAKGKQWDEVKRILGQNPSVSNVQPLGRWSALHWAAAAGDGYMVSFLMSNAANINAKASCGRTPIDVATNDTTKKLLTDWVGSGTGVSTGSSTHSWGGRLLGSAGTAILEVVDSSDEESAKKSPSKHARSDDTGAAGPDGASPRAEGERHRKYACVEDTVSGTVVAAAVCSTASDPSSIAAPEGRYLLSTSKAVVAKGQYVFDKVTRQLSEKGHGTVGTFLDQQVSPVKFQEADLEDPWRGVSAAVPCVQVVNSEIIEEIQKPCNGGAFFVLPSQLNGAEYPSENTIVAHLDQYKLDRTGGPRGQLAVHPAAGQFVLNNAACDRV